MTLRALSLHARDVSAEERDTFEQHVTATAAPGSVLVATCHRVELYGEAETIGGELLADLPAGTLGLEGERVVRHLVRLAVGLESAVVAEDQVLHQLRRAAQRARERGPLPPALDRAVDLALRAGRRARTWLPRRNGLTEVAFARLGERLDGRLPVLVVGAGEMGRRAARALVIRHVPLAITSRTPERAAVLAAESSARLLHFDPGADELRRYAGVVVALSGRWPLAPASRAALAESAEWLVDLSAPSALDTELAGALGERLTTIDDLAEPRAPDLSPRLLARLDALVEETVAEHARWMQHDTERRLARVLAERASEAQSAELHALWQRMPDLPPQQRVEVERMAQRLAERLLRDPLEQLDQDHDGRHARAARSLFRL